MGDRYTRGIVFDLFHTLVDPEIFRPKEFRRAEQVALLLGFDKARFLEYWEGTSMTRLANPRPEVEYVRDFLTQTGRSVSTSLLEEAEGILGRYQDLAILNPQEEIVASLRSLKDRGFKLGLLSNTFERDVRHWSRSPLAPLFDAAVFSHEIGKAKPDSGAYDAILKRLGMTPLSCVYVGDGGSDELLGAKKAGFRPVIFARHFVSRNGLRTGEQLRTTALQADLIVDSFAELARLEL